MNQEWQASGIPSIAVNRQPMMSNNYLSAHWPTVKASPMGNVLHWVQYDMSHVHSPHVQICHPSHQNMASANSSEVTGSSGYVGSQVHQQPTSFIPVITADNLTVEQTAEWIRTLGRHNMWEEADAYGNNFAQNSIWGYLLQKLTDGGLKDDLGVVKYEHRLKIMWAIGHLFPRTAVSNNLVETDMVHKDVIQSPVLESSTETGSVKGNASPTQMGRSPAMSGIMINSPRNRDLQPEEHKNEVTKWGESANRYRIAFSFSSSKVLPLNSRSKSERARPTNPMAYKTLRKVKIRAGKSGHSNHVGYLPKGSVVVINQIKGRSGRVVFEDGNRGFKKAGWVTLYTQDKQQLLKKYNLKCKDYGLVVSSVEDAKVE